MKKIMLILISVIMLFTACKETSTEPNAYEENFNGITFGMTKEEVIAIIGRAPDYDYDPNIKYKNQIFFDVTTSYVSYHFDENSKLYCIFAVYKSYDESEKEQMSIDLAHVKDELSEYYPENTLTRIDETDNERFLFTESRVIQLKIYDDSFDVAIMNTDD